MKADKSPSTTTERLKQQQLGRLQTALFLSWLSALLVAALFFLYLKDAAFLNSYDPFMLAREISHDFHFARTEGSLLPHLYLRLSALGQPLRAEDITNFFYLLLGGGLFLALLHSFILLIMRLGAKQQIQKQLEPLYRMARTAVRLSDESLPDAARVKTRDMGEQKIHNLESAIHRIEPDSPNSELHTGDTDLKGLETAINNLVERTRQSYSQQVRFVSDASHELRTPIAVIRGYADMLDRWGKTDPKILDESIDSIKTESEHMSRLVEQLLFLARGDSGRQKLELQPLSLTELMKEVYEESVMIDAEHLWELHTDEELFTLGDAAMLKQAVRILVDNAAKYSPPGETIRLKAVKDAEGVPLLTVQDSGIGIPGQDMSHIFERFYRSDPARRKGGTGLGLSIAKWIIDNHGGHLDVLSGEGLGTRISIHLPTLAG